METARGPHSLLDGFEGAYCCTLQNDSQEELGWSWDMLPGYVLECL